MDNFCEWVVKYQVALFGIANIVFFTLVLFFNLSLRRKLNKFRFLVKNNEDKNLETILLETGERSKELERDLKQLKLSFDQNLIKEENHIQNWALVRFQAFQNTGGDLSFALALLDAKGNGVVISSLFGRDESRVYCKPIEAYQSSYALSREEVEAIKKASVGINNIK